MRAVWRGAPCPEHYPRASQQQTGYDPFPSLLNHARSMHLALGCVVHQRSPARAFLDVLVMAEPRSGPVAVLRTAVSIKGRARPLPPAGSTGTGSDSAL